MTRLSVISMLLFTGLAAAANPDATQTSQNINLTNRLQIPGAVLQPGTYTFSVEDRLPDRAIVRVTGSGGDSHYLLLTVPNQRLRRQAGNRLILFHSKNGNSRVLRGWLCPGCSAGLEFVYPKSEAVKITDASAQPVLAVAPESDHLPATLSADDMKVVTLWLLTPKRIMAGNRGKGVKAVKYSGSGLGNAGGQTSEMASARPPAKRLPKTASDTFSLALWGLLSIMAAGGLYARRRRREI